MVLVMAIVPMYAPRPMSENLLDASLKIFLQRNDNWQPTQLSVREGDDETASVFHSGNEGPMSAAGGMFWLEEHFFEALDGRIR